MRTRSSSWRPRVARRSRPDARSRPPRALRDALSLWRGPPLHELASLPFAPPEIQRLEEQRLAALEARVEADLATGRHAELVGELQQLTSRHPWRERLQRHLMLALYRCGRQAEALAVYRETRRLLAEELGLEPGEDLRRLEAQMLAHAPELDPPEPVAAAPPPAAAPERPAPARKLVSVVFADVARSTALGEHRDPESMHAVLDRFSGACADALERHGGVVEKFIGDAVVGFFGLVQVHEDDALRAVRAAVEMRAAVAALGEVEVKIAVNSGEAFVGAGARREPFATGDAINVAARLQEAAAAGEILLGDLTRRLAETLVRAEPLEPLAVAGHGATVPAWRLLGLRPEAVSHRRISATPFIGRAQELDRLRSALADTTRARHLPSRDRARGAGDRQVAARGRARRRDGGRGDGARGPLPALRRGQLLQPARRDRPPAGGGRPRAAVVEIMGGDEQAVSIAAQDPRRHRAARRAGQAGGDGVGRAPAARAGRASRGRSSSSSTTSSGPGRRCST